MDRLAPDHALILVGAEAHICVLQTALGLMATGRHVHIVADAVGSRKPESKRLGLARAEKNGADIVTTEMVLFEWLGASDHPHFRAISALIK
jgi:nicotinamidase-related amidase